MTNISRITDIEIQSKIGAAILREAEKGKAVSDFGRQENENIADAVMGQMSPVAKQALIRAGVERMIRFVLGEKIAERIWNAGKGWATPKDEVVSLIKELRFDDVKDGLESLEAYREDLMDLTEEELHERAIFATRFAPLFLAQPKNATLGEIATMKAARGDKLALSFLAWKEIA